MAAALKIGFALLCGYLLAAFALGPSVRFFPIGIKAIVKLRGNCAAVFVSLTAFNRLTLLSFKRFAAYDSVNGLIRCGGDMDTFGEPVIARSGKKKKRLSKAVLGEFLNDTSIRSLSVSGCIGGAENADKAALAFGALQSLFAQLKAALPEAEVSFEAAADLAVKKVSLDLQCIASLRLGKLIIKTILQKRSKGGKQQ